MAGDEPHKLKQRRVDRERVVRTLTFWLRPEFVLRVVNRFQKVAGFDRSIALASGALTATIPLTIVTSAVSSQLGGKDTAERIIDRYELTGGGAEAVKDIFSPPVGHEHEPRHHRVPLPHGRGPELHPRACSACSSRPGSSTPLSVRNTFNGLLWIGGLALYIALSGFIHAVLGREPARAQRARCSTCRCRRSS